MARSEAAWEVERRKQPRSEGVRAFRRHSEYSNSSQEGDVLRSDGTPGWARTSDPRIRNPMLYPLSYEGMNDVWNNS
jgi:hypothetical protein